MEQEIQLNGHNKAEYPPMHTAEHILNQTMVRMFGCPRSKNAHIERKKSKCDYELPEEPSAEIMAEVERRINEVIDRASAGYNRICTENGSRRDRRSQQVAGRRKRNTAYCPHR